ncbi:type I-E CRISPR-associated protein Cas6/Cse3/CasE [Nocardia vulneris]|uniref:type I-E CRISPR-associated protein Cas6/Cse3/CasE n=1 Tax=Nocardia vulneris TaxID=1141657 RepID=UPI0030D4E25A
MYLSQIPLNPSRRGTRKFLASPQVIHAAVMNAYPPGVLDNPDADGRALWRLDRDARHINLYVVGPAEPDFTHIVEQAGWPTTTAWATRKYSQLLDTLATGQRWHFRLTANPVRVIQTRPDAAAAKQRGKVVPLKPHEYLDWLQHKATSSGFEICECGRQHQREPDVRVVGNETLRFERGQRQVVLSAATFEGTLTVTDPDTLKAVLSNGIGRAKGYGCGLLTLAPTQ